MKLSVLNIILARGLKPDQWLEIVCALLEGLWVQVYQSVPVNFVIMSEYPAAVSENPLMMMI